ncbi:galactose-1-epimerase [Vibrio mangrovi]|uniref:Aldose 1-epimerase n=1 Tax=Vibrio mangrovi TaxID=474394 RepID=A0A1Y6IW29_9VIBR|nr:galactose-1-epimerase [Vibrio mangrovi]MDW6004739.1 galactose-1-epimerase [Vibrio mangrovi]SMS01030.1 Aldose 1-epimerase [Vibrio mangrovi]
MQNLHAGQTPADERRLLADSIVLRNSQGMRIELTALGATWLSCRLPLRDHEQREVLLGVDSEQDLLSQQAYLGMTIGPYANRIANASFALEGNQYSLHANEHGNCLHSGDEAFHTRRWDVSGQKDNQVRFSLVSPDGDSGFPGRLQVSVTYTVTEENQVRIEYHAISDQPTPVSLTSHAYFNLQGADKGHSCLDHRLWLDADEFLPIHDNGIPLGALQDVSGTGFDFRQAKQIRRDLMQDQQQMAVQGYDHAYLFRANRDVLQPVATLTAPDEQVRMHVTTTMPAIQLYTGNWLKGTPGRHGKVCSGYAGVALETQFLPDSPNHPEWAQPSCILRPGQDYHHTTCYQFEF